MNSGGSATSFYISLSPTSGKPTADCSADSASGSTYVESYAVHQSVDPTTLSYTSNVPAGTGVAYGSTAFALFNNGTRYEAQTTAPSTGQVQTDGVPFAWNPPLGATQASKLLYNGSSAAVWNVGIACWNSGTSTVTDIWNTTISFNPDSTDPAGYTWTASAQSNPPPTTVPATTVPATTVPATTVPATTIPATTIPAATPTTSPGATVPDGQTSAAALGSGTGNGTSGGTGSSAGTGASDPAVGSSGSTLPVTGLPLRHELTLGIAVLWLGVALLLVSALLTRRTDVSEQPIG